VAAVALQLASLTVPVAAFGMFNMAVRPLVFAVLAAAVLAFMGRDARPIPNAYNFNLMAFVAVVLLGGTLLSFAFIFGAADNAIAPSWSVMSNNLWNFGSVVLLGEYIRYKLIKSANPRTRMGIAVTLTLALAFTHMGGGRAFVDGIITVDAVFVWIFAPLVISVATSYFAVRGGLLSAVLVGFAYNMVGYLTPLLPYVTPLVYSLMISGAMFVSVIICHLVTNEKSRDARIREKRLARYAPKPVFGYVLTGTIITVIFAFFLGSFTMYPVVVLTGSMEPTLARGSLAFIEKIPPEEVFEMVGEGYVIHFTNPYGTEFIHRVVGHWYNHHGERHYITQGDAGEAEDPFPVPQRDVLGIARASLPFFGYPYIFFQAIQSSFN